MINMSGYTIFYTDDDPEDLEFFREVAQGVDEEFQVVTIQSAFKLMEFLNNPPPNPNVLFLDINMPGKTGFDILKEIRANEKFKNLPIIMFTTSNDSFTIDKSRRLGANLFIPKPADFPMLKKSIEFALKIDWKNFVSSEQNFVYAV